MKPSGLALGSPWLHTCQPEPGALLFLPLVLGGFDSDRDSGDIAADACSAFHRSAVGHKLDSRDQHGGFRLMARRDPVGIRLITRRGNDWTTRYPLGDVVFQHACKMGLRGLSPSAWDHAIDLAGCRTG